MIDGKDEDFIGVDTKIDQVGKPANERTPERAVDDWITIGARQDACKARLDLGQKTISEPLALRVVPSHGFGNILFGRRSENDLHGRRRTARRAFASSHGTTVLGSASCSASR